MLTKLFFNKPTFNTLAVLLFCTLSNIFSMDSRETKRHTTFPEEEEEKEEKSISKKTSTHVTSSSHERILPSFIPTIWNTSAKNFKECFINDCKSLSKQKTMVPSFFLKKTNGLRVATYNVQRWEDPKNKNNAKNILGNICNIDADIIILQEVTQADRWENQISWKEQLERMRYPTQLFSETLKVFSGFGNLLLVKNSVPINNTYDKIFTVDAKFPIGEETRGYIHTSTKIGSKTLSLYGFHLDVHFKENDIKTGKRRFEEIQELLKKIKHDPADYIIFMGDFNCIRLEDYNYPSAGPKKSIQTFVEASRKKVSEIEKPEYSVHNALKKSGFIDCFTYSRTPLPPFTCSYATMVDFIYIKDNKSSLSHLPISCGILWDAASDHVPVFIDIVQKKEPIKRRHSSDSGDDLVVIDSDDDKKAAPSSLTANPTSQAKRETVSSTVSGRVMIFKKGRDNQWEILLGKKEGTDGGIYWNDWAIQNKNLTDFIIKIGLTPIESKEFETSGFIKEGHAVKVGEMREKLTKQICNSDDSTIKRDDYIWINIESLIKNKDQLFTSSTNKLPVTVGIKNNIETAAQVLGIYP